MFAVVAACCRIYGGTAVGDDTFIYLQYAKNALHGNGFTFNAGEPSFGVTSPGWLLLMTPVAAVFGNSLEVWRRSSSVLFALAIALLTATARRSGLSLSWSWALAGAAMLDAHTFRWASSGMENGLAALLVTAVAVLSMSTPGAERPSRPVVLGALSGLMPFVRPELAVLAAVLVWRDRRRAVVVAALAALTAGAAMTLLAFGHLLPQTAAAKAIALRQLDPAYGARQAAIISASGAGALAVLLLLWFRAAPRGLASATWALVIVSTGYLGMVNHLVSTRYASYLSFPIVAAAIVTAVVALPGRPRLIAALLACHAAIGLAMLLYLFPATRASETDDIRRFAQQVRSLTQPGDRIALGEVGTFGFFSDRYVVDLVGLVDRASLGWLDRHGQPRDLDTLEILLQDRHAQYFVDSFAPPALLEGRRIRFTLVTDALVRRSFSSRRFISPDRWRLYRIEALSSGASR